MTRELNDHEKLKELGALATSGTLTADEWAELRSHLQICTGCCEAYSQYLILAFEEIPLLTARYGNQDEQGSWDDTAARKKLFARVLATKQQVCSETARHFQVALWTNLLRRMLGNLPLLARAVLAACLVGAVGLGAYHLGSRAQAGAKQTQAFPEDRLQSLVAEKKTAMEEMLDDQKKRLFKLQEESSQRNQELTKLRSALRRVEDRARELAAVNTSTNEQLRTASQQRDALSDQVREAEQDYQSIKTELSSLRSERDKALQGSAAFESRIEELSAATRNQERKLADYEQYLAFDRDIRELVGARKLYIADVFDVDSRSQTRTPFGRVFYTAGKSLIFYAFDLEHHPKLKNASAFQVWGKRETHPEKPLNLGILYMDDESNRRWVLQVDDPEQLREIDAVFVTIEPPGGSQKPTGKPFLYALLRKEANHP